MTTGKQGLMVRVMGTSLPQPITTQANHICKEIEKLSPGTIISIAAGIALKEERELEFIKDMAHQIQDHPVPSNIIFTEALDAWILELSELINNPQL